MVTTSKIREMTAEEFFEWANHPENAGKQYELENGEIVEMPSPGEMHGIVCWLVSHYLGLYVFARGSGYVCTNDTGLVVKRKPDSVRGPDVMLFLDKKSFDQASLGHVQAVPQLVVEVFSPSDKPGRLPKRVRQYHDLGVPLVWVVFPEERTVSVYQPNDFHKGLDETDELTGNGVLPDFRCRVADLFSLPGQQPLTP